MRTTVLEINRATNHGETGDGSVRLLSVSVLLSLTITIYAQAQTSQTLFSPNQGSVPSGPATKEVQHLTLRSAINMAVRYNLGVIESGENARVARGQRLRALSNLLPQLTAGATENVEQATRASLGIRSSLVPFVLGPFAFSTAQASLSQTLFSF